MKTIQNLTRGSLKGTAVIRLVAFVSLLAFAFPAGAQARGMKRCKGVSHEVVRPVLQKYKTQLRYCARYAETGSAEAVRVNANLFVSSSGKVKRVRVRGAQGGFLESCLARSIKRWRFPAQPTAWHHSFPVLMR